jgi:hypothetical protein
VFDWLKSRKPSTKSADQRRVGGSHAILEEIRSRVPRYLDDADNGKLIYPACKRALSDLDGDIGSVWDHTRLEAMRYLTMVPSPQFELLTGADPILRLLFWPDSIG